MKARKFHKKSKILFKPENIYDIEYDEFIDNDNDDDFYDNGNNNDGDNVENELIIDKKGLTRLDTEISIASSTDFDSSKFDGENFNPGGPFKYNLKVFRITDMEFQHISNNDKHRNSNNDSDDLVTNGELVLPPISTSTSKIEEKFNSEMKNFETNVSNRIITIESNLKELINLVKTKQI